MDIQKKVWETLCSKEKIEARLKEMGQEISKDYKEKNLLVISLLRGSFIFAADLVREIEVPCKIEFMTTSSYGHAQESSGTVQVVHDVASDLTDYDVLVVDDIIDSGITMEFVKNYLKEKNPASVRTCVLLDKPRRRKVEIEADYVGFEIEDKFVVGYGLNYGDYFRNIPYVFAVTDQDRD
ncbi:hypoxanthine phosphoribosyltransferase [Filifactor villosus]|uniref:Hypoxanthine phosphoribosyltransferase n=1 Tax=Filifactor villosus TaxID=29374 RepID=A0ABV9QII8_9FIRM